MSLSGMQKFSEFTYSAMTEVLKQNVEAFNQASNGAIMLTDEASIGDHAHEVFFGQISNLVRRRNVNSDDAVTGARLDQLDAVSVKVAAGTPAITLDKSRFRWLQLNPEQGGIAVGEQLAKGAIADMLNTACRAMVAATPAALKHSVAATAKLADLNSGAAKFGDASSNLAAWIMHSKQLHDLYGTALANAEQLFNFGNVQIMNDGFGRPIIMTDAPTLITAGSPNTYHALGVVPMGIMVKRNSDFDDSMVETHGKENIGRTYQAEWSYNVGVKGYSFSTGIAAPTDAQLGTAGNWTQVATDNKSTAGVIVTTQ
jgi:hypothetical protein